MSYFNSNIYYLEDSDLDNNYNLYSNILNPTTNQKFFNKLVVVLIQGDYCGYCRQLKPVYQKLADTLSNDSITFCTIQIDSKNQNEQLFQDGKVMTNILRSNYVGVPVIALFYDGKLINIYEGDRTYNSIKKWILTYLV
jgi:thiol-disulfide isomerase/thioredoxin